MDEHEDGEATEATAVAKPGGPDEPGGDDASLLFILTAEHASLVSADYEFGVGFRPRPQNESDVHGDVLLVVSTRRHVEQPPSNQFEPSFELWPRRRLIGCEPLGPKLDRKTYAHEANMMVV